MEVQAQLVGQREAFAQVMVHLHGQPHLRIVLVRDAGVLRVLIAAGGKGVLVVADGRRIAIDERGIVVLSAIGIGCARALVREGNALRSIAAADCIGVVGQHVLHHVAVPIVGGIEHGGQLGTADAVLIHGLGGSLQAFGGNVPGLIEVVPVPCGGGIPLIAGVAVFVGQRLVYQRLAGFPPFRNFPLVASGMKNAVVPSLIIQIKADAESLLARAIIVESGRGMRVAISPLMFGRRSRLVGLIGLDGLAVGAPQCVLFSRQGHDHLCRDVELEGDGLGGRCPTIGQLRGR